jgi:nitroreductase
MEIRTFKKGGKKFMEFKVLVKERRSCRVFETSPVTEEQLAAIIEAGQWAPNPLNLQPWEFIVIRDGALKAEIRKASEDAKQLVMDNDGPKWAAKYSAGFLEEASVLVVVVYNPSKGGLGNFFGQTEGALQATSACVQNMLLAAADQGLGTLWFTWFEPEKLHSILNIPENLKIAGVIPIGVPKGATEAPPRKPPKIHTESYHKTE